MESAIINILDNTSGYNINQLLRRLIFNYPDLGLTFNDLDKVSSKLIELGIDLPTTSYINNKDTLYDSYTRSVVPEDDYVKICSNTTRTECTEDCQKVHFQPIIRPYSDHALGHCSYLNTCYPFYNNAPPTLSNAFQPAKLNSPRLDRTCKYLHFQLESPSESAIEQADYQTKRRKKCRDDGLRQELDTILGSKRYPAQYINCDLRSFDYNTLGKFQIIVADPPWDIHMSLPYGTLTDDEMRKMPMSTLSEEGTLIFLWVTGRAMDLGRECLSIWGFKRVEEIAWVKINQLQRLIRTGRTGHWLNHTKEHCLVGMKVSDPDASDIQWPEWLNRGLDTDVIVSEVRETSRKPDELYGMIERCCPVGRKVELFGRRHNGRDGWLTLGNQIGEDEVYDPELSQRLNERYPEKGKLVVGR
ncbi:MT-A70-domain-containing protein [Wallemia mellicola]|uniref:mRNA m(6)A methyltransferase n=1 Tax=Wallemia mellicola TaxID=1708541 RepID=A0A4T0PXC1_9BASI|nr:hypothetical protein E3Q23_00384 [Wallemia mellicola]TIB81185.1 MT-A70-domain-containing protein [Wallemia mellicola]TIB98725.1 MT-A70-domain-containing protein [Wallemia mellicola]TIC16042.1 MT-A70-domain-containing protein [Wallemia mellicola]TIC34299.1 MT-A70-domain-containing protein [Wallemia mellicola]